MKKTFYHIFAVVALMIFGLTSCEKNNIVVDQDPFNPGAAAHFNVNTIASGRDTMDTYFVDPDNTPFNVPIGVTNVADVDRTVSLTVSYGSAVEGVQVNTLPTSVVIPAGEAEANFVIPGLFSGYADPDRSDTITITINENSDFKKFLSRTKYKVVLRQFCEETNVVLNNLLGFYDNTNEDLDGSAYGPYTTEVTTVTSTGPTTAEIGIANIWDTGWGPITFELDWTDANARVVRVVEGVVPGADAGDLISGLAGQPVYVKPHPTAGEGTFSYCSQSFDLVIQLGYGAGTMFPNVYTVTVRR